MSEKNSDSKWQEKDGVITLSVTSDGTTGDQWVSRLETKGFKLDEYSKQLLASKYFGPTNEIIYSAGILKGELFTDDKRTTRYIRKKAQTMNLKTPNAEIACLLREYLTDDDIKAMGLRWILIMHEPIEDSDGSPSLLYLDRNYGGWLRTYDGDAGSRWYRDSGFVSVASQISA